jgi:hypothetical protein
MKCPVLLGPHGVNRHVRLLAVQHFPAIEAAIADAVDIPRAFSFDTVSRESVESSHRTRKLVSSVQTRIGK